jgi:ribonuclease J
MKYLIVRFSESKELYDTIRCDALAAGWEENKVFMYARKQLSYMIGDEEEFYFRGVDGDTIIGLYASESEADLVEQKNELENIIDLTFSISVHLFLEEIAEEKFQVMAKEASAEEMLPFTMHAPETVIFPSSNKIRVIIHRGTHQIGGTCTEIATGRTRLLFDLGSPLEGDEKQAALSVDGVTSGRKHCDGLFLTHYHGDHIGEVQNVLDDIPVYMTAASKEILHVQQTYLYKKTAQWVTDAREITPGVPVTFEDLTVTPIASDHSAFMSVMYLVEGFGKKILLTGDYRLHGQYADNVENSLKQLAPVNLLITEGTNLTRGGFAVSRETEVQDRFRELLAKYKYVFLLPSSGNLDRIADFSRCVPRGKYMLTDDYQKKLLDIQNQYCPGEEYKAHKVIVYGENLAAKTEQRGFGMVIRANDYFKSIVRYYFNKYPSDTCLIYSMWSGYKEKPNMKEFLGCFENCYTVHVSGHVTREDMIRTIDLVKPRWIIINHTEADKAAKDMLQSDNIINIDDEQEIFI